jgi:hypothetical protein
MEKRICEVLFTMLFALPVTLPAQTTTVGSGAVVGSVRDTSGSVIPDVAITVKEVETGAQRVVQTDNSGNFTITNLPIGFYTLRAEKPGFKTEIQERFALQVDQRVRVDLLLHRSER